MPSWICFVPGQFDICLMKGCCRESEEEIKKCSVHIKNYNVHEVKSYLTLVSFVPRRGGGRDPHMKGAGTLVGNCELNPEEDRSGRGASFFDPQKDHVKTQTYESSK